jgi:hypothetical protein
MAVNAAWLVYFISVAILCAVIGSTVAFSAIMATATVATNASYGEGEGGAIFGNVTYKNRRL